MSIEDVAFEVCTALDRMRVVAVLSGGGASTYYAPEAHQTKDLDFVLPFVLSAVSEQTIFEIGFAPTKTGGTYARPETPFTLEFIDGPLAVGDETIRAWSSIRRDDETLHILTPTDCVRDRLAAAIHWRDLASLRQAVAVARRHPVDLKLIEAWCAREGGARMYERFAADLLS